MKFPKDVCMNPSALLNRKCQPCQFEDICVYEGRKKRINKQKRLQKQREKVVQQDSQRIN